VDLVLLLGLPQRSDELEFDLPGSARRVREAGMQRQGELHRRARSLTRELGSPSTNAEMSAMLDFAILVSSTCPAFHSRLCKRHLVLPNRQARCLPNQLRLGE